MPEACFTSRPFEISPVDFTRPVPSRPFLLFRDRLFHHLISPSVRHFIDETRLTTQGSKTRRRNIHRFPIVAAKLPTFFSRHRARKTRQLGWSREVISAPILPSFSSCAKPKRDEKLTRLDKKRRGRELSALLRPRRKRNVALRSRSASLSPLPRPFSLARRRWTNDHANFEGEKNGNW